MSNSKKRKPKFQVAKPKEYGGTDKQRIENAIAASHEQPVELARRAIVDPSGRRYPGDVAAENIEKRKRMVRGSRDPMLDAVREHTSDPSVTGYVSQKWVAGGGLHDISLGEADMNLSGEQVLRHVRGGIPMHDPNEPIDHRLPKRLTDEQTDRIIYEHPKVAMEGLAKLGRVLKVPMTDERDAEVHVPPFDGLELKARVAHDLMTHRYLNTIKNQGTAQIYSDMTSDILSEAIVVDTQPVYDRWMGGDGNDIYELRMAPPWFNALLMYNNSHGNVWAMHLVATDIRGAGWDDATKEQIAWQPQEPADHKIEWDQVRWVYSVQVYVGGLGKIGGDRTLTLQPTTGPLMVWRVAVYDDGVPADVHWTHVTPDVPFHKFNNAMGAMSETINMCNCVNVHVAESDRQMPRAQRRRMERYGVRFSEVHIRPASKSYRGKGTRLADMQVPIHGVRGHYATYGEDGRGLLFGKYAGRFWIPPHVRGSQDVGQVDQRYVAEA